MRIRPDEGAYLAGVEEGMRVPFLAILDLDGEDAAGTFEALAEREYAFLLESGARGGREGRYSYLGLKPEEVYQVDDDVIRVAGGDGKTRRAIRAASPLKLLQDQILGRTTFATGSLPPFSGGLVGYLGYELIDHMHLNPRRICRSRSRERAGGGGRGANLMAGFPLAVMMRFDELICFDHLESTILVVANGIVSGNPSLSYREGVERVRELSSVVRGAARGGKEPVVPSVEAEDLDYTSNFDRAGFERAVERGREYIEAGDIFQVVLSQRLTTGLGTIDPFELYRMLGLVNPSPYMFYLALGPRTIIGSSPELLVKREGSRVQTRPLAGTRPRGDDEGEDRRLGEELLADEKEQAEHIMLVDLGRNDLGRISSYGTVEVTELLGIERYSNVMHLVSHVEGRAREGVGPLEVIEACFPAGTVSGAPKIRAMEIIEELEPDCRGPYAGAVGYIDYSGDLDMCITIRTMYTDGDQVAVQAGAGIVYDSDPAREYRETLHKAGALLKTVACTRGGG